MVHDLRRRLPKRDVGIVAEGHDARVRDFPGEEVSQPELVRLRVCPGRNGIAAEAVDGNNTVKGLYQQVTLGRGAIARRDRSTKKLEGGLTRRQETRLNLAEGQ